MQELPFCGHGTLAAAQTLFRVFPESEAVHFDSKAGRLVAKRVGDGVLMVLPGTKIDEHAPADREQLLKLLGQTTSIKGADVLNIATFDWNGRSILFELQSECDLAACKINGADLVGAWTSSAHDRPSSAPKW
jgi:predicted PhzF superfamily epimerase YddE/YHI9